MLPGLYSAASGISAAQFNHEIIARNLAHADVPGFRRQLAVFGELPEAEAATQEPAENQSGVGTQVESVQTDFTLGKVRTTGRPLDVALLNDGFFELEGPNGPLYTRNGVFHLSGDGTIVSADGLPVVGDGGPIVIPAGIQVSNISIGEDGTISAGRNQLGRITVATFEDNSQLETVGTTLFQAPGGVDAAAAEEPLLKQGARELSNVSAVNEMVRMIVGMRHHETSQRAMNAIADALSQNTNPQTA